MLAKFFSSSRYVVIIAVIGSMFASLALLLYEIVVVIGLVVDVVQAGTPTPTTAKKFAVGMIEAVDVFLIAIALYIIGLGFYALFIDDRLEMPAWLKFRNLEDLKANLISVIVAVLAVMFLRQAIATYATEPLLSFAASLALMIAVLTFFLIKVAPQRS